MDLVKKAIKNSFMRMIEQKINFSPEVFCEILSEESNALGISNNAWFASWSAQFSPQIKKELNNYPIKNKNDFIKSLASILHNNDTQSAALVLNKAILVLKKNNIIKASNLIAIEKELDSILASKINVESSVHKRLSKLLLNTKILSQSELKSRLEGLPGEHFILLCEMLDFEGVYHKLGEAMLKKLFFAFYNLLESNIKNEIIGIYNNGIMIVGGDYGAILAYLDSIRGMIKQNIFIYQKQKIDVEMRFFIKQIKDLR